MGGFSYRISKRLIDLAGALLGLLLTWPLFIAIAVAIKCDDGGAVFFRQTRVGLRGQWFTLWKFRSMREGAGRNGALVTVGGDPRVTPVGRVLRKTKLDELPQLLNVVWGDMSLVGPRPESLKYSQEWERIDPRIAGVKPGLTSKASLIYADEEDVLAQYDEPEQAYIREILPAKVAIDVQYFENASFIKDTAVLVATLKRLCLPVWQGVKQGAIGVNSVTGVRSDSIMRRG